MPNSNITISHPVKILGVDRAVGEVVSVDSLEAQRIVDAGFANHTAGAPVGEVLIGHKTTAQSVTNSVALTDLTGLAVTLLANLAYEFEALVGYDAPTANDGQFKWVLLPAGATMVWSCDAPDLAATVSLGTKSFDLLTEASTRQVGGIGAGARVAAGMKGRIQMGATPGVVKLQGAQVVAGAGLSLVVAAGSFVSARRL